MIKDINLKSKFLKYVIVLMSGTLAAQLINLGLSVPLFRYFYSPEQAAEWGVFLRIIGVGGAISTARYELAIPIAKIDSHSFQLHKLALRIAVYVFIFTCIAAIIPIAFASDINQAIYYALIPAGVLFTAYYGIGTNWAIRNKKFRSISFSKVANSSLGGGTKLLLGWMGTGYIGLIIGTVVGLAASNIWFLRDQIKSQRIHQIRKKSLRNRAIAKEYSEFPKVNLPHTLMDSGRELIVAFLFVGIFSKVDFGFYDQSYRILRLPLMLAGLALGQVFFQRSAEKYNNKEDIMPIMMKSIKMLALISILPFTLIFLFGDDMFAYVFSEKWRGACEFSQIMAPWFMLNFIASPLSFLPLVLKKQRQFFLMAAAGTSMMLLAIVIPSFVFDADIKVMLWALSLSQTAYFIFFIFKILDYVRKSNLERGIQ